MDFQDRGETDPELSQGQESELQPDTSTNTLPAGQDVVTLPPGASLDDIVVEGRDLVIQMADGSRLVIPDGAVFVPQIVIDGVTVPPFNIAQLLAGNEPQPAAGTLQSSGGNFAEDEGAIQDAFDLGDLLPFTDFGFPQDPDDEIIPDLVNRDPDVVIRTPNNPAGAQNATASVDEAGLPARGNEPEGTNAPSPSENTTGTIVFSAPDGLASVTIEGVAVTSVGQTIATQFGTLTITGIDLVAGTLDYSYTLGDNTLGAGNTDVLTVVVTENDGDQATATLTIAITDDAPIAADDLGEVPAGSHALIAGDVLVNDVPGADGYAVEGAVLEFGNGESTVAPGTALQGEYGVLTLNSDGTYSYARDGNTPGGVEESFTYTIVDQDGSTSTATLVIAIGDARDVFTGVPREGDGTVVNEGGLPARGDEPAGTGEISDADGTNDSDPSERTSSTVTFNSPDGVASLTINGVAINGAELPLSIVVDGGTLVITNYTYNPLTGDGSFDYQFTLNDNTQGDTSFSFELVLTDLDGDRAEDTLVITVVDDMPSALDDNGAVAAGEYGPIGGNVVTNDTPGADGVTVSSYSGTGSSGATGETVQGTYGTLTIAADGTFSYTRDPGTPGGVSDTFSYTITDGDGDEASANLIIAIADSPTTLDLPDEGEGGTSVAEAGLAGPPAGSDAASNSEQTTGTFTYNAPDGPAQVTIDGVAVTAVGQLFSGDFGTLRIDSIADGSITYTYTLATNTSGDLTSDGFVVRVTDQDGDFSEATLDIAIVDDVPTANPDFDSVSEDGALVADGNVLTGSGGIDANATDGTADVSGADGASVTAVAFGAVEGEVGIPLPGAYGTFLLNADGSYTYTLNNDHPLVQGLDSTESLTEVFTYTITDGDGDSSTTTVTIQINGQGDPITIGGLDTDPAELTVDEDDLADGSSPDDPALTQTGSFTITSQDGLAQITAGGLTVWTDAGGFVPGQTLTTAIGTFVITGVTPTVTDANGDVTEATVSFSYVINDNSLAHSTSGEDTILESFAIEVTDTDGSTDSGSVDVLVIDDVPTATDNSANVTEGGSTAGNVLTDDDGSGVDVSGADGYGAAAALVRIDSVNQTTSQTSVDLAGNLVLAGEFGTLTINVVTGVYSYESDANSTNVDAQDVFSYTIADGDGDEATATLTINIDNVGGQVFDNDVIVNEAGLDGIGSDAGSDSETDSDGQITVIAATGPLVYTLLSPADGTYGTLTLDADTGAYSYTLDTPFTDSVDENGPNAVNGAESFAYEVRDTFGNLIGTGEILVSIIDDVPTATDQAGQSVAEDAVGTIGGNVMTDGVPDTQGADGAEVTAVTIGGATTALLAVGTTEVVTANGTYNFDRDGTWTFDPNADLDHSGGDIDASFTYTLTDGDGDFDTAIQPITITDGAGPAAGPPITLALDDKNLSDGSTPLQPDFASGMIVFTPGSDSIASIVFGDVAALGGGLTWVRVSDTQITGSDGARLVVTLDLAVVGTTATVTATLNDNYDDHPGIDVADIAALGSVDVVATDSDGDPVSSTVTLTVSDDLPTLLASAPAANALTVDESNLALDATADFSGLFTPDYNADNPGTIGGYVLGINPGATGIVDTATGQAVVLVLNAGVVEGRTAVSNDLVFTVTVDAAGMVELDQLRAVRHDPDAGPDQPTGFAAANLVTLSATVTDSDGDTATATANIASGMTFRDDAPSLSNVALSGAVDVDETDGFPTSDTSAASILSFTSAFGADGDGGTVFTISVSDANSGLATAVGDFPITLVQTSATVITGQYNDGFTTLTAFTVTINANGTVTLLQNVALEHLVDGDDSAGEHNDALNLAGKIDATVKITDGDGDTDSETVAIGGALTFFDDGPSVILSGSNPDLQVSDADLATDASLSFAGAFTFNGGNDGTESTSYALSVVNGSASGIFDTATGNQVFLFLEAGIVVGREGVDAVAAAAGQIVFTVTVTGSSVELDQLRAIDHTLSNLDGANATLLADNLVQLTATITDNDGDTDSATLDIGADLLFADDTPTAATPLIAYLDDDTQTGGIDGGPDDQVPNESNLTGTLVDPTEGFGNDGGTVAFATTGAPAGFQYVASGSNILIQQQQGTPAVWVTVITVTLDANTGDYSVTQNANILHADDGNNDENEQSFTLSATLTDGDGDTAPTSLTIVVDDDTPTENAANSSGTVDEDGLSGGIEGGTGDVLGTATIATGSVAGFFNSGADAPLTYALSTDTSGLLALKSGGVDVTYDVTGNTLTASAGVTPVFTIVLDPDTGGWTFTLLAPLDHADGANENDITVNFGGMITATDADGDTIVSTTSVAAVTINDDSPVSNDVLATPVLDDDAHGTGNAGGTGDVADQTTASGVAGALFSAGADGVEAITVSGPAMTAIFIDGNGVGNQETVAWNSVTNGDGSVTVTGSTTNIASVAVLTVYTDGSYTYTQSVPVVSSTPGTPGAEETDNFVFIVQVEDNDGDIDSSNLTIQINDDTPTANDDTNSLSEDTASVGGNVLTDGTPDVFGADGKGITAITAGTGNTLGTWGTLSLGVDGTYTYNLNNSLVQDLDDGETRTDSFDYTIEDGDGDSHTASLTITINGANDAPVANADTNWTIEDAAAAITGNVLQTIDHTPGAPSGTFGDVADTDVDVEPLSVTTTGAFNGDYGILTLNSDGSYSYRLYTEAENAAAYAAVQALNAGDVPLTDDFNYTASDGDLNDSSTLTISIFGANDAPVVGTATVATSDEGLAGGLADTAGNPTDTTNLATANGTVSITDVDDTTFTVTLSVPTESLAVSDGSPTGAAISWSLSPDGKTLTGEATVNAILQTAITVVIDDTGAFTVTQSLPIFHSVTGTEDVTSFTVDVSVNDGTTTTVKTDAITVNLEDDSPIAVVADDMGATNTPGTYYADLDIDDNVDNNFGGDGGRVIFTQATIDSLVLQALTSDFAALSYSISADGTVLTAVKSGTTDTVFTITLDPDTAQNDYVLNLVQQIDSTSTIDFNDGGYNFVGGNGSWAGFTQPGDNDSPDLLLTPVGGGTVNTNANEGGIASGNSVGSGEAMRVDYVTDLIGSPVSGGDFYGGDDTQNFDGHYQINGGSAFFTRINTATTIKIKAFDDDDSGTVKNVGDGTPDTITSIVIIVNGASALVGTSGAVSVGGVTFTVTFNGDGTVNVAGVVADTRIAAFTADGYNSVEWTYVSGDTFKIGDFGATAITNDPVSFDVEISVTDLDGDIVDSGEFMITLDPVMPAALPLATSSQSTQSFSTSTMLLNDPLTDPNATNDNGSGSGMGGQSSIQFQSALRIGTRMSEISAVAALSGAILLSEQIVTGPVAGQFGTDGPVGMISVLPTSIGTKFSPEQSGLDSFDPSSLLTLSVAGPDASDLANLLGTQDGLSDGRWSIQSLQAEPDQFEPLSVIEPQGEFAPAMALPTFSGIDASMEALLMLDPAQDLASLDGLRTADAVDAALSEIAVGAQLDQILDLFEGQSPVSDYLVNHSGGPDVGILDHHFEAGVAVIDPAQLDTDQAEAAIAATAQA
ncbi:T1SS-143 repeat domain-containing protein [Qipengyuania sp. CAU 1752]